MQAPQQTYALALRHARSRVPLHAPATVLRSGGAPIETPMTSTIARTIWRLAMRRIPYQVWVHAAITACGHMVGTTLATA